MPSKEYDNALDKVEQYIDFFHYIISTYGEVRAIKHDSQNSDNYVFDVYHDFFYYCFTKSTKSLYSAVILSRKYLREDALIILRTVYENYLHISHAIKDPSKINEYVFQAVGLINGCYSYKRGPNGKINYKYVIENNTNKEFPHGTSARFMAVNGIRHTDSVVHDILYKYLSEHAHPNMVGSGNYRDRESIKYTAIPQFTYIELPFIALYLSYLLLDTLYCYHSDYSSINLSMINREDENEICARLKVIRNELASLIEFLDYDGEDGDLKQRMIDRVHDGEGCM